MFNNKIKKIIVISLFIVFFVGINISHAVQLGGLEKSGSAMGYDNTMNAGKTDIAVKVGFFAGVAASFLGVIFMIIVLMGALEILGANGNEEHMKKGKERIKDGAIGILLVLAAYLITRTVLELVSGGGLFKSL